MQQQNPAFHRPVLEEPAGVVRVVRVGSVVLVGSVEPADWEPAVSVVLVGYLGV